MIAQEHPYGCGVACVAELLDVSYHDALGLFPDGVRKAQYEGFYLGEITAVMRSCGWGSYWVAMQPHFLAHIQRRDNIAYLGKSKIYPSGHYLIRETDEYNVRPVWKNSYANYPIWPPTAGLQVTLPYHPEFLIVNRRPR